jgi:hypothetical protein
MTKKIEESFNSSYLSQFKTFEEAVASKDCSTTIGLRELLEKLIMDTTDQSKVKEVRKYYENLVSMHCETP